MTPLTPNTIVDFIADIFTRRGAESYLGENVTMSEHMLQGALLAEQAGASDTMVAGALLHDIGHYTNEFGDDYIEQGIDNLHEEAGAKAVGVVHDQRRSSRLRETTEFPPPVRLAHATARRGGDELAEQTDVHLESVTYPKDAGQGQNK